MSAKIKKIDPSSRRPIITLITKEGRRNVKRKLYLPDDAEEIEAILDEISKDCIEY